MSRRKGLLLGVAIAAMAGGIALAMLLPSHKGAESHGSSWGGLLAVLGGSMAAISAAVSARRQGRQSDESEFDNG